MKTRAIKFMVTVMYSSDDGGPICEESMKENLENAIENERVNGAITPDNISANHVEIEIEYAGKTV